MCELKEKADEFRKLHSPGHPLVLFNIWDPGSEKVVARAGARSEQVARIRAARMSADQSGIPYFINAHTDVFSQASSEEHAGSMLGAAIHRAAAYAAAGADGVFVPGLHNSALISRLAAAPPVPLNIMVSELRPNLDVLSQAGVARVSHGPGHMWS